MWQRSKSLWTFCNLVLIRLCTNTQYHIEIFETPSSRDELSHWSSFVPQSLLTWQHCSSDWTPPPQSNRTPREPTLLLQSHCLLGWTRNLVPTSSIKPTLSPREQEGPSEASTLTESQSLAHKINSKYSINFHIQLHTIDTRLKCTDRVRLVPPNYGHW